MSKPKKILVFGATSAIATATARLFAKDGASFYLCARNEDDLKNLAGDLMVRGAKEVTYSTFDALGVDSITGAIDNCVAEFPKLDGLLIAHGTLSNQRMCEADLQEMRKLININFASAAAILTYIAPYFENQGYGTIAVISSVAGDRGRQTNYVYGSAKGALTIFLSGLRQRLHKAGVKVVTIKPGFVDTPMTKDFEKGLLWTSAEKVGLGVYKAFSNNKDVVYLPWFWRWIMLMIKLLPERLFKNLAL